MNKNLFWMTVFKPASDYALEIEDYNSTNQMTLILVCFA